MGDLGVDGRIILKCILRIRLVWRGMDCCACICRQCELLWKRWWNVGIL